MAALLAVVLLLPVVQARAAAELADGTYTADYLVLKAEDDSVSMANDYWEKPATIIMKDGKATIQLTINHSTWVTEFKVPGSGGAYVDTKVIGTNKEDDKRRVEFAASHIEEPILSKIHVKVGEIDYDHGYTIRISFAADSFKLVKAPEKAAANKPAAAEKPAAVMKPAATKNPVAANKPAAVLAPAATDKPAATSAAAEPAEKQPAATANPKAEAAETQAAEASSTSKSTDEGSKDSAGAKSEERIEPEETSAAGHTAAGDSEAPLNVGEDETITVEAEIATADAVSEAALAQQLSGTMAATEAAEQENTAGSSFWWIVAAGAGAALAGGLIYNFRRNAARRDK